MKMNLNQLKQKRKELKDELLKIKWCRGPIVGKIEEGSVANVQENYTRIKNHIEFVENEMEWEVDA